MGKGGSGVATTSGQAEWLTRRQVARIMAVDERRVCQMDGRELHPVRRGDRSWVYAPDEVAAIVSGGTTNGTVTARVFSMFRDGKSLPDVAIETLQPARRIRELRTEYDDLSGSMTIDAETVQGLRSLLGGPALADGTSLLMAVRTSLETKYREGFLEGRADAEDYGEVTNPTTGERRKLTRP
jgi:hypothetical protein